MQFKSDILQSVVERPAVTESTALGAAYLAGFGTGFFSDTGDIEKFGNSRGDSSPGCRLTPLKNSTKTGRGRSRGQRAWLELYLLISGQGSMIFDLRRDSKS